MSRLFKLAKLRGLGFDVMKADTSVCSNKVHDIRLKKTMTFVSDRLEAAGVGGLQVALANRPRPRHLPQPIPESFSRDADTFRDSLEDLNFVGTYMRMQNHSSAPLSVFMDMQDYSLAACAETALYSENRRVVKHLEFRNFREVTPHLSSPEVEDLKTNVENCAYVFVRSPFEGTPENLLWRFTGAPPKPPNLSSEEEVLFSEAAHCAGCPQAYVALSEVGIQINQVLKEHNLHCAVFDTHPLSPETETAVMIALNQTFKISFLHKMQFSQPGEMFGTVGAMMLAHSAPLLITEAGTLWTDLVGMKMIAAGKPVVVLSKEGPQDPNPVRVNSCTPGTCDCLLIRGACIPEHVEPYPIARARCFR